MRKTHPSGNTPLQLAAKTHNWLMFRVSNIGSTMWAIENADTTSPKAKELASEIRTLTAQLETELRTTRIDPK